MKTLPNSLKATGRGLPPRRDELTAAAPAAIAVRKDPDNIIGGLTPSLARLLRPQAAYRWLLPSLAAITPQYIEMTLRGALAGNHVQAWELFDLMLDTWPELASCSQELTEGVLSRKLVFEPYHEEDEEASDDAEQKSKVVSAALRRMKPDACADENGLDGTIKDIMSGWFMGQVVLETNWDACYGSPELNLINCGALGQIVAPRSTFWVHPVCYAWNMEGRLGLRTDLQQTKAVTSQYKETRATGNLWNSTSFQPRPSDVLEFPPEKFLIGIHKGKSGTALGGAMLRPLAWWWCASNFSADWLLNLSQLFGIPFRWVNYDPSLPDPLKAELDAMMQNMGSSGWARFPSGTELKFLEAGKGADNSPQDALLDRCDRYARMLVLAQTMSGSQDASKGGGKAFGSVETGVKSQRVDAACKYVASVFNTQLIPSIVRLNFNDDEETPSVRFLEETEGNLTDAQRDQTLAASGLKIGVNFLRKKYNIPAPGDDEETIGGVVAPPANVPKPAVEEEDAAEDLNAKAADVAAALLEDTGLVISRLAEIAQIKDDAVFEAKLRQFIADFPQLAEDVQKDSATSRALLPVIRRSFLSGLTPNKKS